MAVQFILVQYTQAKMCSWVLRDLKKQQHISCLKAKVIFPQNA